MCEMCEMSFVVFFCHFEHIEENAFWEQQEHGLGIV